ncbi:hypothetical protein EVA_20377 [gut metagenome]|uniref:Uncharacterized protein n=1 Tax=gut metagenome TaxID=749906 RepID=J9BVA6_9ZZZZ
MLSPVRCLIVRSRRCSRIHPLIVRLRCRIEWYHCLPSRLQE